MQIRHRAETSSRDQLSAFHNATTPPLVPLKWGVNSTPPHHHISPSTTYLIICTLIISWQSAKAVRESPKARLRLTTRLQRSNFPYIALLESVRECFVHICMQCLAGRQRHKGETTNNISSAYISTTTHISNHLIKHDNYQPEYQGFAPSSSSSTAHILLLT